MPPKVRKGVRLTLPPRDHPEDKPYPSRLALGFVGSRPLHVVAADNTAGNESITVIGEERGQSFIPAEQWKQTLSRGNDE